MHGMIKKKNICINLYTFSSKLTSSSHSREIPGHEIPTPKDLVYIFKDLCLHTNLDWESSFSAHLHSSLYYFFSSRMRGYSPWPSSQRYVEGRGPLIIVPIDYRSYYFFTRAVFNH